MKTQHKYANFQLKMEKRGNLHAEEKIPGISKSYFHLIQIIYTLK
jgi:hypothetical protein